MEEIMGRYYHGDIEGKFWFAVQSSQDADFFGSEGTSSHLHYYFDEDLKKDVHKGILEMHRVLKTNGKVVVLEFSFPKNRLLKWLYRFYFFLPNIWWISNAKYIRVTF